MSTNQNDDLIVALSTGGFLIWAGLVEFVATHDPQLTIALLAAPFGAVAFFLVIRMLNRRDDPRHDNPPRDEP